MNVSLIKNGCKTTSLNGLTSSIVNRYRCLGWTCLPETKFCGCDIDGDVDVYDVASIPGNRLQVSGNATKFECSIDDVKGVALVVITFE